MFIYVKNTNDLTNNLNQPTVPISWFWGMLQDGNVGWTAATYFASFWIYLLVSVGEFVGWCFYLAG